MGNDVTEVMQPLPYSYAIKVHRLMCTELMKFVDKISKIFPAIESAGPRCGSGIQVLCSLNDAIEKAKLLLQHCTDSSKLYLAITGDAIVLRCERVRTALELNLSQIQNNVPVRLAAQISGIVDDLRAAKFIMESSEQEAGKVVLALLRQDISASNLIENSEFEAFQLAALRLHITSPKALLIEKRSIKKLLDKVVDTDPTKEKILKYFLYLLRKYGKSVGGAQTENSSAQYEGSCSSSNSACGQSIEPELHVGNGRHGAQIGVSRTSIPPKEFKCPISLRLMHDPVVIASGQTFERVWIEKWFNEGHYTCPKTQKKLSHLSLTPNSVMKDLISKWCKKHGITIPDPCLQPIPATLSSWKTSSSNSIISLGSSLNDLCLRVDVSNVSLRSLDTNYGSDSSHANVIDELDLVSSRMNDDSHRFPSSANSDGVHSGSLTALAALPWESQCKALEDLKNHLKDNDQACHSEFSNSFLEQLFNFLKNAPDVKAQRAGAQVLLAFLKRRSNIPSICEDAFYLLASFLDCEITEETLAILEVLSDHRYCKSKIVASGALPSILKVLDTPLREFQAIAIKILNNLSSDSDTGSHIASLECISKLVQFMDDSTLAGYCINILKNICNYEEARVAISEADGCIASIAELLESGTHEEQEHAVTVILSLCSQRIEYCQLVMREGVIPSLVDISVNGTPRGKVGAMELLRLLRDVTHSEVLECSLPHAGSNLDMPRDSGNCPKEKKSSSKASRFFSRKISIFSKPRSLVLF